MKKCLLALAVLGAYTGVATAQSSVAVAGLIDLNGRYVKNDASTKRLSLSQDGLNSSNLTFRGIEDMGGGLRAGFFISAAVSADTGTTNPTRFWFRRSTVSLLSPAGELRLGRDWVPSFWNLSLFDAFGAIGLGSSLNTRQLYEGTRQDNTVQYFLPPNIGGVYGQFMLGAAEGGTAGDKPVRYVGGRVGFASGPFDIAGAYADQRYRIAGTAGSTLIAGNSPAFAIPVAGNQSQKTWNVGGSWNFGFLKLLGYYDHESVPGYSEKMGSISAVIPVGQSEIHVGYDRSKLDRPGALSDSTVDLFKATYQYNLSKRTAVYGTAAYLRNHDRSQVTLGTILVSATALPTPGGSSKGFELGLRHFF